MDKSVQDDIGKNIGIIAVISLVCYGGMLLVYRAIGQLTAAVALGGLIGLAAGVLNLVLLGKAVRQALQTGDQTLASASLRSSYAGRMLMQFGAVAVSYLLPATDAFAAIIALVFPRIAIMLIQGKEAILARRKKD